MRDYKVEAFTHTEEKYVDGVYNAKSHSTRGVVDQFRSDAQPTTPLPNGEYGKPTNYEATFARSTTESGHADYVIGYGSGVPPYGYTRGIHLKWDGWSDRNLLLHGLDIYKNPAVSLSCVNGARSQVLDQLRSNAWNLGTAIAEFPEVYASIIRCMEGAAQMIKRRTPRGALSRGTLTTADTYLAVHYGVKPLVMDTYALLETLESGLTGASGPAGYVKVVRTDPEHVPPKHPDPKVRRTSGTFVRGVEYAYTINIVNETNFLLWKYGLSNPLQWAWELTRLSFVIDWFGHVGDYLGNLFGPLGCQVSSGYRTDFLRNDFLFEERRTPEPTPRPNGFLEWVEVKRPVWSRTHVKCKAMKRHVLDLVEVPKPYLDLGLSATQATSALALLRQAGNAPTVRGPTRERPLLWPKPPPSRSMTGRRRR